MAGYYVDVERAEGLISREVAQRRAWQRVGISVAIAHFTRFYKHRYISADVRPQKALCDAAQSRLIAVMRDFVQGAENFFAKRSRYDNTRRDGGFVTVLEERVFHHKLRPYVCEGFQRGIRFKLVRVGVCVDIQVVDDSCDCWISGLLRDSVDTRVEAVSFSDWARV